MKIKIIEFIKDYLGNRFNKGEIYQFIKQYNKIKNHGLDVADNRLEIPDFTFNPKDVKATFISLVTETYPHGHEDEQ